LANSPWREAYFGFVKSPFTLQVGSWDETKSVLKWTKDGLMAVFFFVVGLEIKYEILRGELSSPRKLATPVFAALGGMLAPALIFVAFNLGDGGELRGWPIPTATDIAFALAALAIAASTLLQPGLLRDLLLVVFVLGALTSLLVNANPLLRFDGYHAVCDAMQLPNLASRSARQNTPGSWRWCSRLLLMTAAAFRPANPLKLSPCTKNTSSSGNQTVWLSDVTPTFLANGSCWHKTVPWYRLPSYHSELDLSGNSGQRATGRPPSRSTTHRQLP
jgi:hypothetical protein